MMPRCCPLLTLLCVAAAAVCVATAASPRRYAHYEALAYAEGLRRSADGLGGWHEDRGSEWVDTDTVTVQTDVGSVMGVRMQQKGVDKFLGIPYAQPPVPPLRFKAPQRAQPWDGVLNATRIPQACLQAMPNPAKGHDNEDCLYLNIFRPSKPSSSQALPVMVWIHGGAYQLGSAGGYPGTGIVRQAERDVMVVTVAYRLGTLGFFTLPGMEEHSNVAFQDMVMGLQWVHENIAAFGGDPARVMLFGESAGGGAVSQVMCMQRSWRFFSRALMESAGFGSEPVETQYPASLAIAAKVGCANDEGEEQPSSEEIMACLQTVDAASVLATSGPVHGVPDIPVSPDLLWMKGLVHDVPTVIGVNELEGDFFIDYWLEPFGGEKGDELTDKQFNFLLMALIGEEDSEFVLELYEDIRQQEGNRAAMAHAYGDKLFCGWTWYQNGTKYTQSDWYQYVFTQPNPLTGKPPSHFGEVPYVFAWLPQSRAPPDDLKTSHDMIQWWSALAATGDPNSFEDAGVRWPPYSPFASDGATILNIAAEPSVMASFNAYYCDAWFHYRFPDQ